MRTEDARVLATVTFILLSFLLPGQFMRCPDKWSFNKLRATLYRFFILLFFCFIVALSQKPFFHSRSFVRDNLSCLARFLFGTLNMQYATCNMQHSSAWIMQRASIHFIAKAIITICKNAAKKSTLRRSLMENRLKFKSCPGSSCLHPLLPRPSVESFFWLSCHHFITRFFAHFFLLFFVVLTPDSCSLYCW